MEWLVIYVLLGTTDKGDKFTYQQIEQTTLEECQGHVANLMAGKLPTDKATGHEVRVAYCLPVQLTKKAEALTQ